MRQLRLVGIAGDRESLVLTDDAAEHYALAVDDRLRAAANGDVTRLGQLEISIESQLRPAEIQARVRSGQSVEEVARAASAPLDRVMRFARPVLQERMMIAERAKTTRVRGAVDEPSLGELIAERLTSREVDPRLAAWDAARREDATWLITVRWGLGRTSGEATWIYDPPGRHVRPEGEAARDMAAPPPVPVVDPPQPPEASAYRQAVGAPRPFGAVPFGPKPPVRPTPRTTPPEAPRETPRYGLPDGPDYGRTAPPQDPTRDAAGPAAPAAAPATPDEAGEPSGMAGSAAPAPVEPRPAPPAPPGSAGDRAVTAGHAPAEPHEEDSRHVSVPSWDDIVFGIRRR